MKIGIFVSGQVRIPKDKLQMNLNLLSDGFDSSELVFGLWEYEQDRLKDVEQFSSKVAVLQDPQMHYEPYIDNPNAIDNWNYQRKLKNPRPGRHSNQTKQILAHNELMRRYGSDYDVVIRSRWDTTISPLHDFTPYAAKCISTPCSMVITAARDRYETIMSIDLHRTWKKPFTSRIADTDRRSVNQVLLDCGILLHRSVDWDIGLVDQLHRDKKLLAAEFGWYQVLVTGTPHKQWMHYDGGAAITRAVTPEDRKLLRKYIRMC